jgi:hypothetical protein
MMKVCHVFLDYETKIEVYAEIYKELAKICGVHDTIYGNWILSGEYFQYDFQLWDETFIADITYYFHGYKLAYPKKVREFLKKKNNVIWVDSPCL